MRPIRFLTALAGALALAVPAAATSPRTEAPVDERNAFAFSMLKELREAQKEGENLIFSPTSIATVLGLAATGAEGETQREMLAALHLAQAPQAPPLPPGTTEQSGVTLNMANAIYAQKGFSIREAFQAFAQSAYAAPVESVDFQDPGTLGKINGWVKEQTRGMIESILDSPPPPTLRVVLLNAIAFEGKWRDPFKTENTKDQPFTKGDGGTVTVPLMSRTDDRIAYFEDEGLQAVELPYGEPSGQQPSYTMVALLPAAGSDLDALVAGLTGERWEALGNGLEYKGGTVFLPRLKMETKAELTPMLRGLGMERAFSPGQAEFGGIGDGLFIGEVLHKAFVEVDEEGTRAAAVTGAMMRVTSAKMLEEPFVFRADRPYVFALTRRAADGGTGREILFLAVVEEPGG